MQVGYAAIAQYVSERSRDPRFDTSRDADVSYSPSPHLRLFKLLENLDAGGDALCEPWGWNGPYDRGSGKFGQYERLWGQMEDSANLTLTMADTTGQYWGLSGEKLWGRVLYRGNPENATVIIEARSHGAPTHEGKLDGALTVGGTATFSIYSCATGSWVDTTENLTVNAPPRLSSGSIATGKWGRIYYELTRPGWTLDSAEC